MKSLNNNKNLFVLAITAVLATTSFGQSAANNNEQPPLGPIPPVKSPAVKDNAEQAQSEGQGVSFDMVTRSAQRLDSTVMAGDKNVRRTAFGEYALGSAGISRTAGFHEPSGDQEFLQTNKVFGGDGRTKITATTTYPWRAQCKIYIKFPSGNWYVGSATMIENNHAITAGHCVYDKGEGGWATTIQVAPGKNGASEPYGRINASNLLSWTGWTGNGSSDHDMGVIRLSSNIGNTTGWLGYGYWSNVAGVMGNIAGYPTDRDGGNCLYYMADTVKYDTGERLYYKIDTFGGQSGSGVYRINGSDRYVMAAHSGWNFVSFVGITPVFEEYNRGTKITSAKFNTIKGWAN
ncbi:MAG: trypsin-like serine protease [Fimbriimonadaceae bacterium]|nr:trypsin-like serine protease [Fimbriimonadaceae bacterium]QYK54759.1 MAG: trypsin-like serine protease [Fimbriimonadaceae bacterium]